MGEGIEFGDGSFVRIHEAEQENEFSNGDEEEEQDIREAEAEWPVDPLEWWIKKAVFVAWWEIGRWRWRGSVGGVLPYGYDAESVGLESVEELIAPQPGGIFLSMEGLERELRRIARRRVRRLYRRKENKLFVNEWDLLPPDENGELRSVLAGILAPDATPAEKLLDKEKLRLARELRERFERSLGDSKVRLLFRCLCRGVVKREEIARRLGLSVHEVREARRRLERRARRFAAENGAGWLVDYFAE